MLLDKRLVDCDEQLVKFNAVNSLTQPAYYPIRPIVEIHCCSRTVIVNWEYLIALQSVTQFYEEESVAFC